MQIEIVGQNNLISTIDNLTYDVFPRSILLYGEYGSGKHTVCQYIANKLNTQIVDITDNLCLATIDDITISAEPKVYVIDGSKITIKEQNLILKFVEEPLNNAFIIILCESLSKMLPTIQSRCIKWGMESYSKDTLMAFIGNKNGNSHILDVARTPGKVIKYSECDIDDMISRANYIIDNIGRASFPNMLKLARDVGYKQEKDKDDFDMLTDIMEYCLTKKIKECEDDRFVKCFKELHSLNDKKHMKSVDKKQAYEYYLSNMWKIMRG